AATSASSKPTPHPGSWKSRSRRGCRRCGLNWRSRQGARPTPPHAEPQQQAGRNSQPDSPPPPRSRPLRCVDNGLPTLFGQRLEQLLANVRRQLLMLVQATSILPGCPSVDEHFTLPLHNLIRVRSATLRLSL